MLANRVAFQLKFYKVSQKDCLKQFQAGKQLRLDRDETILPEVWCLGQRLGCIDL